MPRPASLLVGAVLLILVSAVLPEFAPVLAWPFLFVIPGTLLVARCVPRIGAPGKVGAGIVVSVVGSAHLAYLLAVVFGYSRATVLLATLVLAVFSWLLVTRSFAVLPGALPVLTTETARRLWRDYRGQWISGVGVGVVTGVVFRLGVFHHTALGWIGGGANWSDFLLHTSFGSTIQHGNFPPQTPFLAGVPLVYHYFGDFHAAMASTLSGLPLTDVMALGTSMMTVAFGLLMAELAAQLLGPNRRAAVLAPILAVFTGGIGWIQLFIDLAQHKGSLVHLLQTNPYDFNDYGSGFPYFHVPPLYQVGILVERATAYGIPIMLAALLLLWASYGRSNSGVLLAGAVAAGLAPFNFFAFPVTYFLIGVVLLQRRFWKYRDWVYQFVLLALPIIYAARFVLGPFTQRAHQNKVMFVLGWQDAAPHTGLFGQLFFYATNLGFPFVIAAVMLVWRKTPSRLFLGAWLVVFFLITQFVQLSVVAFDSSKYFNLMWPGVALLAAWGMRNWRLWLLVPAVVVSCFSGLASAVWVIEDQRVVLTDSQYAAAQWIESSTPDDAVFVTASFINQPTDLAGRLRVTGFFTYASDEGFDQTQRDADVNSIYCDGADTAAALMHHYRATYVLNSALASCGSKPPTDFDTSPRFQSVYNTADVHVWKLVG